MVSKNRQSSSRKRWVLLCVAGVVVVVGLYFLRVHTIESEKQKPSPVNVVEKGSVTFGVIPSRLLDLKGDQQLKEFQKIKNAGFSELRFQLDWSQIGREKGKYDWSTPDRIMTQVKAAKLNAVLQLGETPEWARKNGCVSSRFCAPEDQDAFAKFAAAAAKRYHDYPVVAWEVWNEQNSVNFWKPKPDAAQYTHLLQRTYAAIKSENPSTTVLSGGLSGDSTDTIGSGFVDPRTYLAGMYDAGARESFDALAYHPYIAGYNLPSFDGLFNGWSKMSNATNSIRDIMAKNDDVNKKIWITEFGIPTGGTGRVVTDPSKPTSKGFDHTSYEVQAQVTQAIMDDLVTKPYIHSFDWYFAQDWKDADTVQAASYGIWKYDGTPKPVLEVLKGAMAK